MTVDNLSNFYEIWAKTQQGDPFRDITLQWKAIHLANIFKRSFQQENIDSICEVGGAEGEVISAVGSLLKAKRLVNYDLSSEFVRLGKLKFPHVDFNNSEFSGLGESFDIVILSDILEHVLNPDDLLNDIANRCKYVLLKMPIEECLLSKKWAFLLRLKRKPANMYYGKQHVNGHLRGYTLKSALESIGESFQLVDYYPTDISFYYRRSKKFDSLRSWLGLRFLIDVFGGSVFILGKSKKVN